MISRKEILYAGAISLVMHVMAIVLFAAAANLHSTRITLKSPPEFIVSMANLSSNPPFNISQTGVQAKNRESGTPGKTEVKIADRRAQKRSMEFPPPPDKAKIPEKAVSRESGIVFSSGSHQQTDNMKTARQAPSAEQGEKEQGKETVSFIASGHATQSTVRPEGPDETSLLSVSRYREKPQPDYPQASRQRGEEGRVLITVEILENGSAGKLILKRSSGYPLLDQAALKAVRKSKFNPAVRNNVRIRSWGDVPIRFKLEDSD